MSGSQLVLEGLGPCSCWVRKDETGLIIAGHSCDDCLSRALDFLETLLYIDREVSVSAVTETEVTRGEY